MRKILFVLVAIMCMLAMTSCDDKEKCMGSWASQQIEEDDYKGKIYFTFSEDGTATLALKGIATTEEDGETMDIHFSVKVDGNWDASVGTMDLNFNENNTKFSIEKIDTGDPNANALIQASLGDPDVKKELKQEFCKNFNVDDFNGTVNIEFEGDNVMIMTDEEGGTMKLYKK